jgi:putative hydrolase of the HAD superfamily
MIEAILFDLDETLYPRSAGLMRAIGQRIHAYMVERMGISPELATQIRMEYYRKYGTSLRGLLVHYGINPEDYLAFVHDVALEDYIQPNPGLKAMLEKMPLRKAIFTNATTEHALSVMRILGIEDQFERIIDVRANRFVGKPYVQAYRQAANLMGASPQRCVLVEDSVRNLRPGKTLGMVTVLVGDEEPQNEVVDFHVTDVLGVEQVINRLHQECCP